MTTTILVNFTTPTGSIGSIRVADGALTCAAVAEARAAGGSGIVIREVDARGRCVSLARVRR